MFNSWPPGARGQDHCLVKPNGDICNSDYHVCVFHGNNISCRNGACIHNTVCKNNIRCNRDRAGNNTGLVHNNCNTRKVDKDSNRERDNRYYQTLSGMKENQPATTGQTLLMMFQ